MKKALQKKRMSPEEFDRKVARVFGITFVVDDTCKEDDKTDEPDGKVIELDSADFREIK